MKRQLPVLLVLAAASTATAAGLEGIVIDTDRSVNCTSLASIVGDVCRDCKSDQDKAIALYNFMVRTVWMDWHSHRPLEMRPDGRVLFVNDPWKYIAVYGYCGCGPQAGVFGALCEAAGLKARLLDPGFGHVSSEIFWDGQWHWLDVWLPAYVTDGSGRIYSYDEIMADRTRFGKAREQGRVPANFMVNYNEDLGAVMNAKNHKPSGEPYDTSSVENLCLRPGERVTWLWGNVGKWYNPSGPYEGLYLDGHFASGPATKFGNDAALKDAFPFWEPYRKTIEDGPHSSWNKTYYRYYGNAIFVHEPPLTARSMADWNAGLEKVEPLKDGGLAANKDGGRVDVEFQLPYVIADTQIEGLAEMDAGGLLSFSFSIDGGKTWLLGGEVTRGGAFGPIQIGKPNTVAFPGGSTTGRYGYKLRIEFWTDYQKKPTVLKSLKVTNTTMLNFYSRPWLEVGDNTVTVTVANGEALKTAPLEVTWRWLEDWTDSKSVTHKVAKSGQQQIIRVGGKKRPKMESVTIACPASVPAAPAAGMQTSVHAD